MKNYFLFFQGLLISGMTLAQNSPLLQYEIDVTQNMDTFMVRLEVDKLDKRTSVFQFAATAPGTYQTMNIGRFVSDFKALDKKGREIETTQVDVNQYQLTKPHKIKSIMYRVAETFDTQVEEYPIYLMCGSSIEADHTLINAHTMLGYFQGYQSSPIRIKVIRPDSWKSGTALSETDGYYLADDFDHLVDSPILLGELSYADTVISGTPIAIYTFSENQKITSDILLSRMSGMLGAAKEFLVKLPVDRYTFLYYFTENPQGVTGAWEHSYSSEYVLQEQSPSSDYLVRVTDIASHEFFHIVTPLNIHSEIIESFNFVSPTPSLHLWLYEGVTEWASNILQYRGGIISLEEFLSTGVYQKIMVSEYHFDPSWSLKKLAEESFNTDGAKQYGNIYYKGSLVATYLDILLLELSKGKSGLRELILDLVSKYGKGHPFSEEQFLDELEEMTYPAVGAFFEDYVLGDKALPHRSFLAKVGIEVDGEGRSISIKKIENMSPSQKQLFDAWSRNFPRNIK